MPLVVHIMTAALSPGDAIGNYILSLSRTLTAWGCTVQLYADVPNARYPLPHRHSSAYTPRGSDLLWFHYSIHSENVHWLRDSSDFTLLDYHGVCPPKYFAGYDPLMEDLCARGEAAFPTFAGHVDLAVGHTAYIRAELRRAGYRNVRILPLVVDTDRFTGAGDPAWEPLLSRLEYLLFVGRLVPQKNLRATLDLFAALHRRRPNLKYVLVGGRNVPAYADELAERADELGIGDSLIFTGPISEPATLTSFFRHARFYLCLSAWESFCVPIVEALHFGTPVLGWGVPPIPETMGPGGIVLEGDAPAMAAQIDALWDDRDAYARLQQQGRPHAARFTDAALRDALLELFRELAQ
jgi:glycosyltransferase involved in cell wall biosynthesis